MKPNNKPADQARVELIDRRLAELDQRTRTVQLRHIQMAPVTYLGIPRRGNAIVTIGSTTYYGLKYPTANVTVVPTTAPPSGNGACPDGLTYGEIESTTGVLSVVWIGWRLQPGGTGTVYNDMTGVSIPGATSILCRTKISMPVTTPSGTFVDVYLPYRIL